MLREENNHPFNEALYFCPEHPLPLLPLESCCKALWGLLAFLSPDSQKRITFSVFLWDAGQGLSVLSPGGLGLPYCFSQAPVSTM